jgi:hypothetical protein
MKQHPIALDALPLFYIKHPKFRILYQLKSFMVKHLDLIRQRMLDQVARGVKERNGKMIGGAVIDLTKYITMFGGSMMTIDATKNWLLGKEWELSDKYMANFLLRMGGLPSYQVQAAKRAVENFNNEFIFWKSFMDATGLVLPAIKAGRSLVKDIGDESVQWSAGGSRPVKVLGVETGIPRSSVPYVEAESWQNVPFVGRDVSYSVGARSETGSSGNPASSRKRTVRKRTVRK